MSRIYRLSDRVKVRIGDKETGSVLTLAPLDRQQKQEIQQLMYESRKGDPKKAVDAIALAIKYSVKNITGLVDGDDNPYVLEFDAGMLTDSCVEDIMNMPDSDKVSFVAASWINGVPKNFLGPDGNPLPDVEIINEKKPVAPTSM